MDMLTKILSGEEDGSILGPGEAPGAAYGSIVYKLRDRNRVTIALQALTLLGLDYSVDYSREQPNPQTVRSENYRNLWTVVIKLPVACLAPEAEPKKGAK